MTERRATVLMVQGTASSVGKSALVTGLCRIFRQDGYRVAPFKSQNMALNSAVTVDGGEIGRAQAEQARAAGVEPTVDMNPILLKPVGDSRSQVVVAGRPWRTLSARDYYQEKPHLLTIVAESLTRLRAAYDIVVIEGAGSPAEINLRASDIVNMRIAHLADAPVLIAGDIDRGGVFAALVGTMELLEPEDRERVAGFVINKFRGDVSLLKPGLDFLEAKTGKPVLGVVPYLRAIGLAEEDSVALDAPGRAGASDGKRVDIAVIRLPRIANWDDYDPLAAEASVRFVERLADLGTPDLLIVPGTKSTVADLQWLRERGFAGALRKSVEAGTPLLGICGGYQMLGTAILDPDHVESEHELVEGLGLLDVVTSFAADKRTVRVLGETTASAFGVGAGLLLSGYEIHHGQTRLGEVQPWLMVDDADRPSGSRTDGAVRADGLVAGCYIHGLFDSDPLRKALLTALGRRNGWTDTGLAFSRAAAFDQLADHLRKNLDLAAIYSLLGLDGPAR